MTISYGCLHPLVVGIDDSHTIRYTIGIQKGITNGKYKDIYINQEPLFKEVEALAEQLEVSRSRYSHCFQGVHTATQGSEVFGCYKCCQ